MASEQSLSFTEIDALHLSAKKDKTELEEIVVFIDGRTEPAGILEFSATLAHEHRAYLIGVFMQPEPPATLPEMFARGTAILDVIAARRAEIERIDADRRAMFEGVVRRHGIRSEWRSLPFLSSEVGVHAYYADLVVLASPDHTGQTAAAPGLAESLILTAGRPIIMFPPRGAVSRVRRVLLGWNSRREAVRALADALPLLVSAEAVEVLIVDPDRNTSHGQEPGADIGRYLARHGTRVEVRELSSGGEEVAQILVSQAAAFRADLVVMGAYGHSYLREWMFGSVTRTVLRETGLPILMSR